MYVINITKERNFSMDEMDKDEIIIKPLNFSVADFLDENKQHLYVTKPTFQRKYVWDKNKESKLIETIILNLPIPTIYLYKHHVDGKKYVIDGQQRLTAIRRYIKGTFELRGLKQLTSLNDKYFYQLPHKIQEKILDYTLDCMCIMNIINKKTIYDIFERFNTGVVTLNAQEIRNCVYEGKFNDFVKNNLVQYEPFKTKIPEKKLRRMGGEELAVRFLSMYENNKFPDTNVGSLINTYYDSKQYLETFNNLELKKATQDLELIFKKCVDACEIVFKNNMYKNIIKNKITNTYIYNTFSNRIYDIQMLGFSEFELIDIKKNEDKILQKFIELASKNMFTTTKEKKIELKTIIRKWQDCIGEIIYE